MENLAQLAKAVVEVSKVVESVTKNLNVGEGKYAYKGVADYDVKMAVQSAMNTNGLCILPIGIDDEVNIDTWEEKGYHKRLVFTKVTMKYLLLHTSGESIEIFGYGHGVDPQDKSAGKATTYALKYTLLYSFMIAASNLDDSDNTHSDDVQDKGKNTKTQKASTTKKTSAKTITKKTPKSDELPWLNPDTDQWRNCIKGLNEGKKMSDLKKHYRISAKNEKILEEETWLEPGTQQWTNTIKILKEGTVIDKIKMVFRLSKDNEEQLLNEVNATT